MVKMVNGKMKTVFLSQNEKNESRNHIDPPKNTVLRIQSIIFFLFLCSKTPENTTK